MVGEPREADGGTVMVGKGVSGPTGEAGSSTVRGITAGVARGCASKSSSTFAASIACDWPPRSDASAADSGGPPG